MLDTIENILNGNQYPLLRANRQEAYVYRQFLQDTPSVAPNYSPLYKVEFRHIAHHPYKVRHYFRLINNDIYTHLNQFFAQYSEQNKLQIPYHHRQVRSVIEEYISHFYERLQQQPASDDLLTTPPPPFLRVPNVHHHLLLCHSLTCLRIYAVWLAFPAVLIRRLSTADTARLHL